MKRTEVNEEIRDREVRLIDVDGRQIGIVPIREALEAADEAKLDLVKIAPQARPPVCKIMDYGKYKYEQAKMEKEAKKKQRVIQVKEIRLSVNIDDGDMETKARHAIRFLEAGDRLKVSLRFRGRQLSRKELGLEVVERFGEMIKEYGEVDKRPAIEGRSVVGYYAPIKK
ncbi:MAG TPA: translation initiation factor IF-3 [Tissierellia bacterium]|nr:translation initiation factor IF-3 [Tissierellia bacterium]